MAVCLCPSVGRKVWLEIEGERRGCGKVSLSQIQTEALQLYLKHFRQPDQQEALEHRALLMSKQIKPAKSQVTINISIINSYYYWPFDVSVCLKPPVILLFMAGALFILGCFMSCRLPVQTKEPLFLSPNSVPLISHLQNVSCLVIDLPM